MVDVSGKTATARAARARAVVAFPPGCLERVVREGSPKGDLFWTARIAGILAAKRTSDLIPLCHPLPISRIGIEFEVEEPDAVKVTCEASAEARTGVEMEALVGASIAALTLYDMCKALDPGISVSEVRLLEKTGGSGGPWRSG